tara:strand:- start:881 stop:3172 length:2292 start_codon:yes stop_codon:yes gene_type:complete
MKNVRSTILIIGVCVGISFVVALLTFIFFALLTEIEIPSVLSPQKNERTISQNVLVSGLSVFLAQKFQFDDNQKEYGDVTNGIAGILTLHPDDVIYVSSSDASRRRRLLQNNRFNFTYQLDIERRAESSLVDSMNTTSYKDKILDIFIKVSDIQDLGIVMGPIIVSDYIPAPTTNPDKLITQELTITGLTPAQIEENKEFIVANLARKLGINAADIEITGVEEISRRRRLLQTISKLTYIIKTKTVNYQTLVDEVESVDFRVGLVEEIADAVDVPAEDLIVNSRKVIAEDYEPPKVCSTDCSILNTECSQGTCEEGECVTIPRNERQQCDDQSVCTENDQCLSGICVGIPLTCYDNNPCTIDQCVENVGCMKQEQTIEGTCIPGCLQDSDCPVEFICHDGTCLKIEYNGLLFIRFINYEIQDCEAIVDNSIGFGQQTTQKTIGHRLITSFIMDAQKHLVATDNMFRVAAAKEDIYANRQPLGFIDEVIELNIIQLNEETARSAFTLTTACQSVTAENCNSIFADRRYEFDLKVKDCENINVFPPSGCIDPNSHVSAHISLSINDCSEFENEITYVKVYGESFIYYNDIIIKGLNKDHSIQVSSNKLIVGIITDWKNHNRHRSILTNVRACIANPVHRLSTCVDKTNTTECYNIGCYNWVVFDSPLTMKWDFMENGYFTALSLSTFNLDSCYKIDVYHSKEDRICDSTCSKYGDLEDGFEIDLSRLPKNLNIVFDLVYKFVDCEGNAFESEIEQYHQLVNVILE